MLKINGSESSDEDENKRPSELRHNSVPFQFEKHSFANTSYNDADDEDDGKPKI